MLIVLDTCNIAVSKEPTGGIVFRYTDVTGLPPDVVIMVPIEGKERAQQLIDGMQEAVGPKITADLRVMKEEIHRAGLETPHP